MSDDSECRAPNDFTLSCKDPNAVVPRLEQRAAWGAPYIRLRISEHRGHLDQSIVDTPIGHRGHRCAGPGGRA